MPLLIPALGGALVVAGIIGVILGARRTPATPPAPRRGTQSRLSTRLSGMERRTKILAVAGLIAGAVIYLFTGWLIAVLLVPLAAVGLRTLLSAPPSVARIDRLEALEEWTRALAGVLTVDQDLGALVKVGIAGALGKFGREKMNGVHFQSGDTIRIEGDRSNVVLDGEVFEALHDRPIILKSTPPVPFLSLAA